MWFSVLVVGFYLYLMSFYNPIAHCQMSLFFRCLSMLRDRDPWVSASETNNFGELNPWVSTMETKTLGCT